MKTLFILRHAKSSWSDPGLSDFDRPLNERGSRAAPFMGKLMRENSFNPDVILSSPALRAKETAIAVKTSGEFPAPLHFEPRIYEASPDDLREVVAELDDAHNSAMLVGHNPGLEGFIGFLTGGIEPMPTAALAVIGLDAGKWAEIDHRCGTLLALYRPRDEMAKVAI